MALTKVTQDVLDKHGRKNAIINGDFDIWQRGTSQTSSGYGSDDRWFNPNTGSTKVNSQQTFTFGQTDVPNNPTHFSRTVVTSVVGTTNHVIKAQRIEGVETFSGETVTLSFWAKADSAKNIATEFLQRFGTGGTPSAILTGFGVTTHSLTTSWQKFKITTQLPSIAGKTLGSDGNDALQMQFWFESGSNYDARTNSLGQQSGTFDIAQVQLEEGTVATDFESRTIGEELSLCQRYYQIFNNTLIAGYNATSGNIFTDITFLEEMTFIPTVTLSQGGNSNTDTLLVNDVFDNHIRITCDITTGLAFGWMIVTVFLDAEV